MILGENVAQLISVDTLRQVGEIKVGGTLVTLDLSASVESLVSEADIIAEVIETANAFLRVPNIGKLGKAEAGIC